MYDGPNSTVIRSRGRPGIKPSKDRADHDGSEKDGSHVGVLAVQDSEVLR